MILRKLAYKFFPYIRKNADFSLPCKYLCIKLKNKYINKQNVLENLLCLQGGELRTITKIIKNFLLLDVAFYVSKSILLLPGEV